MLRLRFLTPAWRQLRAAAQWRRKHRDKAPDAFDDDLAEGFLLIRREPGVGVPVRFGRRRDVRKLHLERIRYDVYYRVVRDEVRILAIRHSSRRPPSL
ncbi:MAG: toxin ParE1/3/4 [Acidobacteriota bacterium]|jgi:plasmid stabilization system protein ParE|nr:toxin ParE1/3/4 [Acidobacteriota bacterium]